MAPELAEDAGSEVGRQARPRAGVAQVIGTIAGGKPRIDSNLAPRVERSFPERAKLGLGLLGPHCLQNLAESGLDVPQTGQGGSRRAPHS